MPVGLASSSETLILRLERGVEAQDAAAALNARLPSGLRIERAARLERGGARGGLSGRELQAIRIRHGAPDRAAREAVLAWLGGGPLDVTPPGRRDARRLDPSELVEDVIFDEGEVRIVLKPLPGGPPRQGDLLRALLQIDWDGAGGAGLFTMTKEVGDPGIGATPLRPGRDGRCAS